MLLLLAPLSLVRGGFYNYSTGNLGSQSSYELYWSRRLLNAIDGSLLSFDSGSVRPQNSRSRGDGFTARCLALEKDIMEVFPVL